ncbi:hypothetical protein HIM_11348 [Hirsutella minnesotensis 3608]|uniref:Rhodopsin domain-containing protein n=1 Tax=Hirsutella minnesotensis 3608 TaxID=1043627 RepID=A0A0F8A1B5_9HYPO|nr:hypothetical protein HIM_11348 [Hirsutella minnesotensis 3608]
MFPNNSKANELFVIQIVCLSSCWILALMRFWVKLRTQTRAEDVLIAFALHGITQGGIGKSILEISPTEVITAFKVWYACELIYGPLAAVIRTSIAFLILRVCRDHWVRVTLFACLGIIYTFTVVYFFINLLQCFPPSYYWTQFSDPTALGYCAKPHLVPNVAIAHSLLMAFTDWVIGILLPIIPVRQRGSRNDHTDPLHPSCGAYNRFSIQNCSRSKISYGIRSRQNGDAVGSYQEGSTATVVTRGDTPPAPVSSGIIIMRAFEVRRDSRRAVDV